MSNDEKAMLELLPCPFCGGEDIELWTGFGTQADIVCSSCSCDRSVQVADMREDGEPYPEFDNSTFRYPEWLIQRTNEHLISEWNTRASALHADVRAALEEIIAKAESGDWTLPSSFAARARTALSRPQEGAEVTRPHQQPIGEASET